MNQRINELIWQCAIPNDQVEDYNRDNNRVTILDQKLDAEKFAELIIADCVQVCKPVLEEPYEDMDEFDKGLAEGMLVATEIIKRHFGVEE